MRLTIDTERRLLTVEEPHQTHEVPLYSTDAFEIISREWLRVGWERKYSYTFTWLGRPIIQLPDDLLRIQEVVYSIKPDVIIETGVAHGGSLVFFASLCRLIGKGRIIGVDVQIRPMNREAIARHDLSSLITLVEGDSTAPDVVDRVKAMVHPGESVFIVLDSAHTREHVLKELTAYSPLVTLGSYMVAADGLMKDLTDVPRGKQEWSWDNPSAAASEFARLRPEFRIETPTWLFNESSLRHPITQWPGAWLRRIT